MSFVKGTLYSLLLTHCCSHIEAASVLLGLCTRSTGCNKTCFLCVKPVFFAPGDSCVEGCLVSPTMLSGEDVVVL